MDSQRQEEQKDGDGDDFDGDDLADEMNRLDISSSLPLSLVATRQQKWSFSGPEPEADSLADNLCPVAHQYLSLNNIMSFPRDSFGAPSATAPNFPARRGGKLGRRKPAKYRKTQAVEDLGLSSGLLNMIFRDITRREGGKRYARLGMDDSGRWRVVRYSNPSEVFTQHG